MHFLFNCLFLQLLQAGPDAPKKTFAYKLRSLPLDKLSQTKSSRNTELRLRWFSEGSVTDTHTHTHTTTANTALSIASRGKNVKNFANCRSIFIILSQPTLDAEWSHRYILPRYTSIAEIFARFHTTFSFHAANVQVFFRQLAHSSVADYTEDQGRILIPSHGEIV